MVAHVIDPVLSLALEILVVEVALQADRFTRIVFGADGEREIARLSAIGYERLSGVKIALGGAVRFEDVAPAARADVEIHCRPDLENQPAERGASSLIFGFALRRLPPAPATRQCEGTGHPRALYVSSGAHDRPAAQGRTPLRQRPIGERSSARRWSRNSEHR
jgi:hypothetical protein